MKEPLGYRLKLLRIERGLTVRDVSELTGLAFTTVSRIEREEAHPHDITVAKLARAYQIPPTDLLEPVPA
jgi:transcriptional regulator with XRE-family HTH domain